MQNDANVVHLTRVASEPSPNAGAGRLPVILVQVRDKAALQLKQALQALFDNADDTLFEMADRATSNLEQNAFFEAMRDLRLKRKSIERVYLQKVFEEFSALNQVQSGKSVPTLDTVSFDSLSLVQNEELEESVAVDAMVARVMSRDATALAHLSTRLNTLVGRKVDEKSNPLAPRPLTAAFLDACQGLGVEIKVKLIILKLFEKYVLAHCDQLYAEANQILVAAGVLPELKSALPRRQPAVRPEAVRDAWRREEAQAAFHVAERDLGILGGSESELIGRVHGHLLWQGYQSFFAVIFWYALLGPVAALAYRLLALALEHARQPALREQAARVRHILDWLPVRALVLSFALVGNFLAVIRVLLHWLLAWDISAAALLGKAGRVASDVEAVELGAAGVASLDALWQLLVRAAVLWYAVFAFCALFL
ncbi:regulatory signaling modulator protein AmpE [Pseudomonas aeruginosa]|uniref:regulatory signaling modulator protein AmpE n=1 Tax=Pseudomonas aeruginosa TaxID=287 RepID=UPI002AC3C712|nr:regulatory signaling modulator protein AmpE [Pseudomonas aeruginosa]MDZ5223702.1 regulatory signaling modulator protein AmpE [Pseudomonas aeruginosa]MDZ5232446.1 regulatory signaling modulator protein AmpE [Pseudomonas aeruginosa]MDZ5272337.1 regulatory signaling modulator protein AmpE [Pseudomonas aeruginosa]MDZ5278537.1 regulatory signaling modulator protein AmpE [Pseudomonas aeruginosa]MDZ5286565.1 regulatory signaling modulator protein AmpE [Pseudomonas aeruginosa]